MSFILLLELLLCFSLSNTVVAQTCTNGLIRLTSGSSYYGRVEVCAGNIWGTICSDFWDYEDASVVCSQLGYSPYGAIHASGYYTEYQLPFNIIDLNCTGNENSIWNCPHNGTSDTYSCPSNHDASIVCQDNTTQPVNCKTEDIRLAGGTEDYKGRLEVCINQVWGTVCSINWGDSDTKVACRQLGYQTIGGVVYVSKNSYGQGSGPIMFGFIYCGGNEDSIFDCNKNVFLFTSHYCSNHYYDLVLKCEPFCEDGTIRLRGYNQTGGRVEVCVNGTWGTVCSDFWDNADASVTCTQLGYSRYGAIAASGYFTDLTWPFFIIDLNCIGEEDSIWNCSHNRLLKYNCPFHHDASLQCQDISIIKSDCEDGDVRLVGGNTQYEGRVEVCINHVWGTVCSSRYSSRWTGWSSYYSWGIPEGNVVCKQLGHTELGSVTYTTATQFGQGTVPILMSLVQCSGQESNLINCSYSPFPYSTCSHYYDVGVKCEGPCKNGTVRLYNESGSYFRRYGQVQVCVNDVWGTVCHDFWDDKDASVVCRMLGYDGGSAQSNAYGDGGWYVHINDLNCTGEEESIWDCPQNESRGYSCTSSNNAGVICESPCINGDIRLGDDGSYNCICNTGYTLELNNYNCTDIDECTLGINGCNQNCVNTDGSYLCSCFAGYHLMSNQKTCVDINECLLSNGGCSQICTNTLGSYQCSCNTGFLLNITDRESCDDINECTNDTHLCEHNCYNTNGSYTCDCQPGYQLSNGLTCSDINECDTNNGGCDQECINQVGSYYCQCNTGYTLDEDGHGCSSVANDCAANPNVCEHTCHNSNSSFYCTCKSGYRLASNGRTCDEIDECSEGLSSCNQTCSNIIGGYYCTCYTGFELLFDNHTCQDINECSHNNGGCEDTCNNSMGSYKCSCQVIGYSLDNDKHNCSDINECSDANGGCAHSCTNTPGSYHCNCGSGYNLDLDGHSCTDVNECTDNNGGCEHICVNNEGSYSCSCKSGYSLNSDGRNCSDINECDTDNGGCEQICINTVPFFNCSCNPGFRVVNDKFCLDIDECSEGISGCSQLCSNTIGSYICNCHNGYQYGSDNHTCLDINECTSHNGGCEQNCQNTIGSYSCSCLTGYFMDSNGYNCTDINECNITFNGGCSQTCINTPGSYVCSCFSGYILKINGHICVDINECDNNNGGCAHHCINKLGSYQCQCDVGFNSENDGSNCTDIDECSLNMTKCTQGCHNSVGSYQCTCQTGYYLGIDNHTCFDIDECAQNNGGCSQRCVNNNGSFHCECTSGYSLIGNGFSCEDLKVTPTEILDSGIYLDTRKIVSIAVPITVIFTAVICVIVAIILFLVIKRRFKTKEKHIPEVTIATKNPLYFEENVEDEHNF